MSDADRTFLRTILDQDYKRRYPDLDQAEHFEIFSAEQVLKYYNLDSDEIESGRVGASSDGGVDLAYFFIDKATFLADTREHVAKACPCSVIIER